MKKLTMIIAAFAMAGAAFAQTSAKDNSADAKATAKAEKIQKAAALKAFKQKQKEDLQLFIERQKDNKPTNVSYSRTEPVSAEDSVAYIFGVMQSNGLKQYVTNQLHVDSAYFAQFCEGVMETAGADPNNKEKSAVMSGQQIGGQVLNMTKNLSKDYYSADPGKEFDAKIIATALIDGMMETSSIKPEDARTKFQSIITKRQEENKERLYGKNKTDGEKWLEENKSKEGVITLPSGVQYKILSKGNGTTCPTKTDRVKVNYEGHLIDGTEFDSSYKRKEPATFGVSQVIKGWTEALQLMHEGDKWEVYIPYQLAYGEQDKGTIKPYSALIFTVELIEIVAKK